MCSLLPCSSHGLGCLAPACIASLWLGRPPSNSDGLAIVRAVSLTLGPPPSPSNGIALARVTSLSLASSIRDALAHIVLLWLTTRCS